VFGPLYRWYFRAVLPWVGQLLSRSREGAYSYLPASVLQFPDGEELAAKMRGHGLTEVRYYPFTLGIATLYVGVKPPRPPE
jgi:demethylmenaquinone methyltransferase/2-methoxy-6-polyprenyl-1,4-benzoquinol methylase